MMTFIMWLMILLLAGLNFITFWCMYHLTTEMMDIQEEIKYIKEDIDGL